MSTAIRYTAVAAKDRSGTITAGGTAQSAMPVNLNRAGFWFENLSAGDLWISDLGDAAATQPSLKIVAGAYYASELGGCPQGAISIYGATTGQAFSAREW